jgi:predicted transcriptional regulator
MLAIQIDNPKLEKIVEQTLPNGKISSLEEVLNLADFIKHQQSLERGLSDMASGRVHTMEDVEAEMVQLIEEVCK